MAEAMCGPSNPLQQFKQQSSLDRTLQQDRLTSRHSPAQGFRSPNPHAGLLDPEFDAFQFGAEPALFSQPPFQRLADSSSHSQAPAWASDFQHLHISPQPMVQQPRPWQSGAASSDWAQGFREHVAQSAPRAHSSSPSPQAFQQRARFGLTGFQSAFSQSTFAQPGYVSDVQSKGKETAFEQFDEAAFDRAFDLAREDMLDVSVPTAATDALARASDQSQVMGVDALENQMGEAGLLSQPGQEIHASNIEQIAQSVVSEQEKGVEQQQQDDDALAATAQELLEKVEHNQSDKFKNSQFLGLMRKLRDREVRVEGDKMVETANAASTTVGNDSLNATSTAAGPSAHFPAQRFNPVVGEALPEHAYNTIPLHEQDHDAGRVDSSDGQDVVDLLNQPTLTEDIGMSAHLPEGPSFEDDEPEPKPSTTSLPDMLYGVGGPLEGFDSPS